jgi:hypothetical protein
LFFIAVVAAAVEVVIDVNTAIAFVVFAAVVVVIAVGCFYYSNLLDVDR